MRLSPSQINMFRAEPWLWSLKYFYGIKQPDNARMCAGRAAGEAVETLLTVTDTVTADHVRAWALEAYNTQKDQSWADGEQPVEDMAENLWGLVKDFGTPIGVQHELYGEIEGIEIFGILDLFYEDKIVDLKTSARLTTDPSPNELTQCAIYNLMGKRPVYLARATAKKSLLIPLEQDAMDEEMILIRGAARAMRPWLEARESGDIDRMKYLMNITHIGDWNNFLWTPDLKQAAKKLMKGETLHETEKTAF